ncbi:MAG: sulfate permease [bacterium]|nr:sulfate permease [Candidatus Sumerlaeota bacterium]
MMNFLSKYLPCLTDIRSYRREWLMRDIAAGVSVAAIAIPVSIAYAQLAGFKPVVGLYASILPLVAYAIFGSSRQLMVNPDSATCAMIAAVLHPLAAQTDQQYIGFSIVLTIIAGVLCLVGGIARLGFVADFLSYPVLVGYLNGIALSIIGSQLGRLLGVSIEGHEFFEQVRDALDKLKNVQPLTIGLGVAIIVLMFAMKRYARRIPAPLVGVVAAGVLAWACGLGQHGVSLLGPVPPGLPSLHIPKLTHPQFTHLAMGALGVVIVSFCSGMLTARGFAAKNHYDLDANQEFIAFGFANITSGLSSGFMVTGADSRTAINDMMGGKTQLVGVVAAASMAVVLFFLTGPMAYVPETALAGVLVVGAVGLVDLGTLRRISRISPVEFWLSIITSLSVITVGVFPAIVIAISFSMLNILRNMSRPHENILARMPNVSGLIEVKGFPVSCASGQGIVVYRFDAPLLFFNCDHFKGRVRDILGGISPAPRHLIFDAEASPLLDTTAAKMLYELNKELAQQGISLSIARCQGRFLGMLERSGLAGFLGAASLFPSIHLAIEAAEKQMREAPHEGRK